MEPLHRRGTRPVGRGDRRGVRQPRLAPLGTRSGPRLLDPPTGPLPVAARPGDAAGQPRLHPERDRGKHPAARGPVGRLLVSWLLRHGQPQRPGRLPALPRLLRRTPLQPRPVRASRGQPALRGVHGRHGGAAGQGPGRVRGRRLPLGGRGAAPCGVRRPVLSGGPAAPGRCLRATGLPGRVGALARHLPDRRPGATQRRH